MQTTFNHRKWSIGFQWRSKPRGIWIELPMLSIYWRPGRECHYCHGQGGWVYEAGDCSRFSECESCNGRGTT